MTRDRICTGIVLLLVATCSRTVHSEQMVFPGAAWQDATPESQSVDSAKLQSAADYLAEHAGRNGVERLIIVRNGRVIWKGSEVDRRQRIWSITKAFTSTAQGL
ncbi:MAG: hypothetical protein P8078_00625, partial [bacterium]